MSFARRVTALLLMFAWCFANGHLWIQHAGEEDGHCKIEMMAVEDHHHDDGDDDHHHHHDDGLPGEFPGVPEEHHHHELSLTARDSGTAMLKVPLPAVLFVTFFVAERPEEKSPPLPAITGSPPDERKSGYLFVVQTARPVRGPSLVA